ncbi:unnamed protein product [Durusdinium trenchii]|uniref:Reticulocyte-binding protein 2-like a n=1 Tax=Durusdinium trenchii TaxID=1381693 RepID=A0ABP0ML18_9DINO
MQAIASTTMTRLSLLAGPSGPFLAECTLCAQEKCSIRELVECEEVQPGPVEGDTATSLREQLVRSLQGTWYQPDGERIAEIVGEEIIWDLSLMQNDGTQLFFNPHEALVAIYLDGVAHAGKVIMDAQANIRWDDGEEMLPGYVEDLPGFGGFGLLDRTPAPPDAMGCMRGDSFAECPTGAPTSPQRSIATPRTPRSRVASPDGPRSERPRAAHAALTAKMERPEPSFGELRQTLVKALDNFFYIYKDDEEAQRLLIGRKLKERRLRKQRLDDEERRKLREELEELRRQEEARQQEEEARRKAEEQRLREQAERVEEEKRRRQEEERRAAEAQRRREEEAKREEERRVEEARRRKQAEEEAARKAKEIRERLLATMQELAQSRDGWVLKNAIAEGESVGLDAELQPLREALKEVHELRKAALLKARKAQEKLANDFKTAKEAQDFGGPVLAAQWRAAVKEVQKPFVMPE